MDVDTILDPPISNSEETSCFRKLEFQEHISLLPCYVGRLASGITEHLNRSILKYSDKYQGVLLSYSKPVVLQKYGQILDEQPHIHFDVRYTAYVFKPLVGSVLSGVVNKVGGDHVGCVVCGCFNAAVFSSKKSINCGGNSFANGRIILDVGSRIQFQVTRLECIGGVYSISGKHLDPENIEMEDWERRTLDSRRSQSSGGTMSCTGRSTVDGDSELNVEKSRSQSRSRKHKKTELQNVKDNSSDFVDHFSTSDEQQLSTNTELTAVKRTKCKTQPSNSVSDETKSQSKRKRRKAT